MTKELRRRMPDGTSWPVIGEYANDLQWRLRYGGSVSREDALGAASYLDAYCELVKATQERRNMVARTLKAKNALPVKDTPEGK